MTQTLIIVTQNDFDLHISRAAQTTRWGYYHGALQAGLSARFVRHDDLLPVREGEEPIYWLTYDDYNHLSPAALRMIAQHPHIVQVNVWFEGMEEVHRRYAAPGPGLPEGTLRRIQESSPDFVWCSAPEAYLEFYEGWRKAGMKVVSLPWACDTEVHYPVDGDQFSDVELAFVGGYRIYKEPQYEARLWSYQDRLKVWGYSEWPRCYQGYLPNEQERELYTQARLCPTLSEPQFAVTGDTVERPFKVMGCKGLTILDLPCYRALFTADEALIAHYPATYRAMTNALLKDEGMCAQYREAGYKAVLERHTYAHRVAKLLRELRR